MSTALRSTFVAVLLAVLAAPAGALVIDDFESGDFAYLDDSTVTGATSNEASGLPGSSVVGGVRMMQINASSTGTLAAVASATLITSPADDFASLTVTGDPSGSSTFSFIYDGVPSSPPKNETTGGVLGIDLSTETALTIDASTGGAAATVRLTLYSSTASQLSPIKPLVDGVTSFDLAGFTLNKADIQAIRVLISGVDVGETIQVSHIATVPEPTTGLLLGAGMLGLAVRQRRRRRGGIR